MAKRPIRVANCSGALTDPGVIMYNQAKYGPVDVITGDYLAEASMAGNVASLNSSASGWIQTALDGIDQTLELANEHRIKIIVNGGARDPRGLAERVHEMITTRGLKLRVAYVEGDDLMHKVHSLIKSSLPHLDTLNHNVQLDKMTRSFMESPDESPIICADAYLGYRAIKKGLDEGADIIICGRVADASPVMGAAAWWHGWDASDLDQLAGSLLAGHLIECSTYVTGGNFPGAYKHSPSEFFRIGAGIAEILDNGECIITKHEALNGFVTPDTVKCQILYELQGNIYLHSDVKADLQNIRVALEAKDRVWVSGVKGYPPPPTTKLAVFYEGGYQCELLINACGHATDHKWDIHELQTKKLLEEWVVLEKLDVMEFQRIGTAMENPDSQLASTTCMRMFVQSRDKAALGKFSEAWLYHFMSHFPGMHCSLDMRTLVPRPFPAYYPCLVPQSEIEESVTCIGGGGGGFGVDVGISDERARFVVGPPRDTEPVARRLDYETKDPQSLDSFGPTKLLPLGDIALGRSGDKGANINLGLFVQTAEEWEWFRSFMTKDRLRRLMGKDWRDSYALERVEFPHIYAVHFVVYGPLGRGASSAKGLDTLGKGFAEFLRAVHVPVPVKFLGP